ncbi:MAG: transglycosylase domain-containing protein [Deltaproteobacteria bacterium]|nr:transglycosylase domain-containing protein [Deltaproteobacteria bacterium]MCB9788364.1 transglycosylase domain-containing protein [Deltaproteobacteria bacterium]
MHPRRPGGVLGVLLRAVVALGLWLGLLGAAAVVAVYAWYARDLPRLDGFDDLSSAGVTSFTSADGQVVGEWYQERRILIRWDQLPRQLVLAVLAAEDARYFSHSGVDFKGVLRAMITNLRAGDVREGASTITQQLAKTLVGADRSYVRKIREAILARRMEDLYSKHQILTWYLNAGFLGHGSYGVQAAAQNYFRKDLWDLDLAELATIAGSFQSPGRVNPAVNMPGSHERLAHVLAQMQRRGWISGEEARAALQKELVVYPMRDPLGDHVPEYTEAVRRDIAARYDKDGRSWLDLGLKVSLAVEPAIQREASAALRSGLEEVARKQGYPGPLARLGRDAFFERVAGQLPAEGPREGQRYLGRVSKASAKEATVELGPKSAGTLTLERTRWAVPYTELPVDPKGGRDRSKSVSFEGKLGALDKALAPGDVVWVEALAAEGQGQPLALVPIPMMEGALISYRNVSGGVDAMVGAWDFDRSQVDRTRALRQTGSTMKPIAYSKAYDSGLPPSALFSGAPFREGTYNPTGARSKDDMLVWNALVKSENSVSLRVLQDVLRRAGLPAWQAWGRTLGLSRPLDGHTSEVLGADQTPFDMAHAFGVFALRGMAPAMNTVRKVVDAEGHVLERHIGPLDPWSGTADAITALWESVLVPRDRLIEASTAYLITANLNEAVKRGTGKRAKMDGYEVAGKTGTLPYDVWFDGYNHDRTAVVWIGADRRERPVGRSERSNKIYGGDAAAPIWKEFMDSVQPSRGVGSLVEKPPADVTWLLVDPDTGLLGCDGKGQRIPHKKGTEPTECALQPESPQNVMDAETKF